MPLLTVNSSYSAPSFAIDVVAVYSRSRHLVEYYPNFEGWFWGSVVPGLSDGTRYIETVVRHGEIVALLIAKKTVNESKLCTLWVDPQYVGSGMGVRLINAGRRWLGVEKPLATVPEERMPELKGVLEALGFEMTQVVESAYRPGKIEYVFNGSLAALDA